MLIESTAHHRVPIVKDIYDCDWCNSSMFFHSSSEYWSQ